MLFIVFILAYSFGKQSSGKKEGVKAVEKPSKVEEPVKAEERFRFAEVVKCDFYEYLRIQECQKYCENYVDPPTECLPECDNPAKENFCIPHEISAGEQLTYLDEKLCTAKSGENMKVVDNEYWPTQGTKLIEFQCDEPQYSAPAVITSPDDPITEFKELVFSRSTDDDLIEELNGEVKKQGFYDLEANEFSKPPYFHSWEGEPIEVYEHESHGKKVYVIMYRAYPSPAYLVNDRQITKLFHEPEKFRKFERVFKLNGLHFAEVYAGYGEAPMWYEYFEISIE